MRRLVSLSRDTITLKQNALKGAERRPAVNKGMTIGMDLGDKSHEVCLMDAEGKVIGRETVTNTKASLVKFFGEYKEALVVVETGTHSPWISRELEALGCEVLVGNSRKLRMIWSAKDKTDVKDAEMLARIGRFDRELLYPIHHRGAASHADLAVLKARDMLVAVRSDLVNHVRGAVKTVGERIEKCSTEAFAGRARESLPDGLRPALMSVLKEIESLTKRIKGYDRIIAGTLKKRHPEAERLSQVPGVGPVTSMGFVLSLEDPARFKKSRVVGAFIGLTPKRDQSGETDKQLRITKDGDEYLRRLLVGCSHYILGVHGPDCDLRRFGEKLTARGGKNAKRRAIVAVARKLSVLLHRLWVTGADYDPDYRVNSMKKVA
jgi:transposase